jgi:hypothetical protein
VPSQTSSFQLVVLLQHSFQVFHSQPPFLCVQKSRLAPPSYSPKQTSSEIFKNPRSHTHTPIHLYPILLTVMYVI